MSLGERFIRLLRAIGSRHWSIALRIFYIGLLCSFVYPPVVALTAITGSASNALKIILIIAIAAECANVIRRIQRRISSRPAPPSPSPTPRAPIPGRPVSQWQQLPLWERSALPIVISAGILLLFGLIPGLRSVSITIGMIAATIGLLVVGVYAFSARLLYAIFVEASTSPNVLVADAELPAKDVFRTILGIVAWEWAAAWFITTFNPELTASIGLFAFLTLGIAIASSYALGFKGKTGLQFLLYGAIMLFVVLAMILLDRMIQQGDIVTFVTSGYVGTALKNSITPLRQPGLIGWVIIVAAIYLTGVTIAWKFDRMIIAKITGVGVILLVLGLVGDWLLSPATGVWFSDTTAEVTQKIAPSVKKLPQDIVTGLIVSSLAGILASCGLILSGIVKMQSSARTVRRNADSRGKKAIVWGITGLVFSVFIIYQLVFVK